MSLIVIEEAAFEEFTFGGLALVEASTRRLFAAGSQNPATVVIPSFGDDPVVIVTTKEQEQK